MTDNRSVESSTPAVFTPSPLAEAVSNGALDPTNPDSSFAPKAGGIHYGDPGKWGKCQWIKVDDKTETLSRGETKKNALGAKRSAAMDGYRLPGLL